MLPVLSIIWLLYKQAI